MIQVENLSKSYGGQILLDRVHLQLNARERIGLVGRNGHGKTTFLRILSGEEEPDAGAVIIPKQYTLGYVKQHIDFKENTVINACMAGMSEMEKDHHWVAEEILAGLGFSQTDMQRSPHEFSGGFQVRLNLARALVARPNLLLLDEPTNYLDISSIRWIERFLVNWPGELIVVTHDRSFMDSIVTHIVGIHRRKMRKIAGDTEKYYIQIAQDEEIHEKTRLNDERRRKEIELFISRFRAKARLANMVQSRLKTLSKMEKKEKLQDAKSLDFSFRSKPFRGKALAHVKKLTFGYVKERPLFEDLDLTVHHHDRICVVGKNGKGKTSLLKILAGAMPSDSGEIVENPGISRGYYEQTNVQSLTPGKTVEEEILYSDTDVDRQAARNICGAMMFEGDAALKKIAVLSGGEKARVMLGKLLVTPVNLLLLDEPTNHLDMESCDALLAALDGFDGAVIMVTHNELFLHALARRMIVFQNDRAEVFEGDYQEFLEKVGWQDESTPLSSEPGTSRREDSGQEKRNKKHVRRIRSEILTQRAQKIKPIEEKIKATEDRIERLEVDLKGFHEAMQTASQAGDGQKITALAQDIHACDAEIEKLFNTLEVLTESLERERAPFDRQLADLEKEDGPGSDAQ